MAMAAFLFNCAKPLKNCQHSFDKRPHVKFDIIWSSALREEDVKRFHDFIHVHSQGQGKITPKSLMVTKMFYRFNHTLKVSH